jgi:hypothetical protein
MHAAGAGWNLVCNFHTISLDITFGKQQIIKRLMVFSGVFSFIYLP